MRTHFKVALLLFASNLLIVLLFGGAIYYLLNEYSYVDFYKRLETRATITAKYNLERNNLTIAAIQTIREQHLEKLPQEKEYLFEINTNSNLYKMAEKYQLPIQFLTTIWENNKANLKIDNTLYTGIKYNKEGKRYLVIVSADNYYASHHLSFLRNILLGGIFFIILLIVYQSLYFSKHIFAPIKHITDNVKQISSDNIHLRLEETDNNNEIGELTSTFNDLLNRIETAFETQKNFISNASHELGTPLTAIIGEADVALIKERSAAEYQETLQKILQQAERLDQITKSLLFLAQTGYEGKKIIFEVLRADELIWEVKGTIDKLNPPNEIIVDFSLFPDDPKKLKIKGNKQLLHLAIANVLNNACKYSHNKPVSLSIAASNQQVVIIIKDQGVGIPEDDIPFIYDPFYRASNTHFFKGYGIGLPLARNIIKQHNGLLSVSSILHTGTTVQIKLPLAPTA
jgi:signal transduction histidine kinase